MPHPQFCVEVYLRYFHAMPWPLHLEENYSIQNHSNPKKLVIVIKPAPPKPIKI
jgi:hypothetical protein